jgi:hypothetical protein
MTDASLGRLFGDFFQLGYVSDDLDRARDWLENEMGMTEFRLLEGVGGDDVRLYGEQIDGWEIDILITVAGMTMLEVIRPRGPRTIYEDAIRPGKPLTFHHLGMLSIDFEAVDRLITKRGGDGWALVGRGGLSNFGYYDMRDSLGYYYEVVQPGPEGLALLDELRASR